MEIIKDKISRKEIAENYLTYFQTVTKPVIDIEKEIIAIDGELHADLESYLLENGSKQEYLWGINLYPFKDEEDFIEYTALINVRPSQNNYSMEIENSEIREKIRNIVNKLVDYET